jgi:hypothetical protein
VHRPISGLTKPNIPSGIQYKTEPVVKHGMFGRFFTVNTLIRVAFTALSLNSIGIAQSATPYHTPSHNYYQNNWMAGN